MKALNVILVATLALSFAACNKPASNSSAANTAAQPTAADPNATVPPKFISGVNAPFPDNLWSKPGTVTVAATVGTAGSVTETKVVNSPHPELNDLAMDAVKKWKFEPAKKAGQPVPFTITVNLNFTPPKEGQKVAQMPAASSAEKPKK